MRLLLALVLCLVVCGVASAGDSFVSAVDGIRYYQHPDGIYRAKPPQVDCPCGVQCACHTATAEAVPPPPIVQSCPGGQCTQPRRFFRR